MKEYDLNSPVLASLQLKKKKPAKNVLLIALVTANLPSLPDEKLQRRIKNTPPPSQTVPSGAVRTLPARHYAICQQFTTRSERTQEQCVYIFPSESSNPVTTFTLREAISCAASADEVSEQKRAQ